jgi:hypothetical protein
VAHESLQPKALERIRELEQLPASLPTSVPEQMEPPKFITQLPELPTIVEGQSAHFEARLTPTNDPNLQVHIYTRMRNQH